MHLLKLPDDYETKKCSQKGVSITWTGRGLQKASRPCGRVCCPNYRSRLCKRPESDNLEEQVVHRPEGQLWNTVKIWAVFHHRS
mmetsp:Transcript_59273/g.130089  ORF Transcript_59273/g.130089 Transcript_59273/m.130089 type:complete len:84 (-) Transcript_59273:439-690(-)